MFAMVNSLNRSITSEGSLNQLPTRVINSGPVPHTVWRGVVCPLPWKWDHSPEFQVSVEVYLYIHWVPRCVLTSSGCSI